MRSRSCARSGCQLAALTSASNPAASSAHIVVNIASFPSTVTLVTGLACGSLRGGAGAGAAGARAPVGADSLGGGGPTPLHTFRQIFFLHFLAFPRPSLHTPTHP